MTFKMWKTFFFCKQDRLSGFYSSLLVLSLSMSSTVTEKLCLHALIKQAQVWGWVSFASSLAFLSMRDTAECKNTRFFVSKLPDSM